MHSRSLAAGPAVAGLCLALLAAAPSPSQAALATDGYHRFAEVESKLKDWARAHPTLLELQTIGASAGGRTLHVVRIAGQGPVAPDERQAIFVGANAVGFHNAGTEAALDLIESLASGEHGDLLAERTFYVAPVLNPDAHDTLFGTPRWQRGGAAGRLDRDRDGLVAEDGPEDLDGDGAITRMRIPDPMGGWLPHPDEPRIMVRADAAKGWIGSHRIETEGKDDDGDGRFNEDGPGGVHPDKNFAHGFEHATAEAGPWPSFAPEAKALMDFLLVRRNVAAAVIYGPANNFLAAPQSFGGAGDLSTQKFTLQPQIAEFLGLDAEAEYTLDEVWDVAKTLPFVRQNGVTKEQLAQFLGAGPATKVADGDQKVLTELAKAYKERLEEAELSTDRPAEQYSKGGVTPWLYYQYGVTAVELDVWGVPKPEKQEEEGADDAAQDQPLTLDSLDGMSSEDFVALGEEKIAAFLEEIGTPPQFTAAMVIQRVESGQVTPTQLAAMARQMGAGGGGGGGGESGDSGSDDPETQRARDVLAWIDANAPGAQTAWSSVTLPDGTEVEVGGVDPLATITPPAATLRTAVGVHTATVLDLAERLPRLEIRSLTAQDLGGGVYRLKAVAANTGEMPTHTEMAQRAQTHLPVRLGLEETDGVELLVGPRGVTSERLEGRTGLLEGTWLIRADRGTAVTVTLTSNNAGSDRRTWTAGRDAGKGGAR